MAWTASGAACTCEASDDRDGSNVGQASVDPVPGRSAIDAGRIDCDGRLLGRFAWPACQPEIATDFIKSALRDQGWTQQSQVAVLVDGADDLRTVVELAIGLKPRTILDWFHISMRLRCIEQMAGALATRFLPVTLRRSWACSRACDGPCGTDSIGRSSDCEMRFEQAARPLRRLRLRTGKGSCVSTIGSWSCATISVAIGRTSRTMGRRNVTASESRHRRRNPG